jgi:hypothetical protein
MGSVEIIWVLHVEAGFLEEQTWDRARFSFISFFIFYLFFVLFIPRAFFKYIMSCMFCFSSIMRSWGRERMTDHIMKAPT